MPDLTAPAIELAPPPPNVVAAAADGLRDRALASPVPDQRASISLSRGLPLYDVEALTNGADEARLTKTHSWIFIAAGGGKLGLVRVEDGAFAGYSEGEWIERLLATLHGLEQAEESGALRLLRHARTDQWAAWLKGERDRFWPISSRRRTRPLTRRALFKEWRIKDERIRLGSSPG